MLSLAERVPDADIIDSIAVARSNGLTIHDMTDPEQYPGAIDWLAARNIYTTTQQRRPENLLGTYQAEETARQLGTLVSNGIVALQNTDNPFFNDAINEGRLGSTLVDLLRPADNIRLNGLHVTDPKLAKNKLVDGTATAQSLQFDLAANAVEEQELVSTLFQSWLRVGSLAVSPHIVTTGRNPDTDRPQVKVSRMNEYRARIMEHTLVGIVAAEDLNQTGTTLPSMRRSLSYWKEVLHETFDPTVEARSSSINADYRRQQANAVATFAEDTHYSEEIRQALLVKARADMPNARRSDIQEVLQLQFEKEMARRPDILGDSPTGLFEVARKGFMIIGREIRGGGQFNREQHPDPEKRLVIETGVNITRGRATTGQDGPQSFRGFSAVEKVVRKGGEVVADKKGHPVQAIIKGTTAVVGVGVEAAVDSITELVPLVQKGAKRLAEDRKAGRTQAKKAEEDAKKIDQVIADAKAPRQELRLL